MIVHQDYYHLFFIPIFPIGASKTAKIVCHNCGSPLRSDTLQWDYEKRTRTPIYLYGVVTITFAVIALALFGNLYSRNKNMRLVAHPQVDDVYTIYKKENNITSYYFLRLARINGDTLIMYHNNLEYLSYPSKFNHDDFFVENDEFFLLKSELKSMLDNNVINSVDRDYGTYQGFDRLR